MYFEIDLEERERERAAAETARLEAMFDRLHRRQKEET